MTTENRTILEIIGIVDRSWCHGGGQDEAMVDIDGGMFFKPIMRQILLDNPVRVQIAMEFKRLVVFVELAVRRIILISGLLDFIVAGWPTGGFNEPGINGNVLLIAVSR